MGLFRLSSLAQSPVPAGNPVPSNFRIETFLQVGPHVVAEVVYPDATSYEGRKVLVYRGTTRLAVRSQASLDPHFSEGPGLSPFARFEPTPDGWAAAVRLATDLL